MFEIIIAMLERKYSGAEQLIVKLQKESQTLKRETDGKPSMIKRFSLRNHFGIELEIIAKSLAPALEYELGISSNGRTYREGKKINCKDGLRAVMS